MKVLFVCTGNICRSPTAAGVFAYFVRQAGLEEAIQVESAGTHDYHVGQAPDLRAQDHAKRRGYDLSALRARVVEPLDFEHFDLILAMDRDNLKALRRRAPDTAHERLRLFMEFAAHAGAPQEVPDPYYGGPNGFEEVLDLVESAARGLIAHLRRRTRAA